MAKRSSASSAILQLLVLLFAQGQAIHATVDRLLQTNSSTVCTNPLSTYVVTDQTSSHGIVFAVQSAETDTVGPTVLSMGFHVDPSLMVTSSFQYEVYALNEDGYYADPERGENILSDLGFDYRGQLDAWSLISSGEIFESDLDVSVTTPLSTRNEYYEIPVESFLPTSVPPNGNIRSFYATLRTAGMMTADPGEKEVNDESMLAAGSDNSENEPKILIGEQVINYPFTDTTYLYAPRIFMGKVIFEKKCPTEAPSISIAPSFAPSNVASESPSYFPSSDPSSAPSDLPSSIPSSHPSSTPSVSPSSLPSLVPTPKAEEVRSGLLLSLDVPGCIFDASGKPVEMSQLEQNAVAETIKANIAADAEKNYVYNTQVEVVGLKTMCGRRLSDRVGVFNHRQLPSGAAAVEFSMIITGEYRPPIIAGEEPKPVPKSLDLGSIAEDSINRDPEKFIRDLKDRAPPTSSLNEVETLNVEAVVAPPEGEEAVFTMKPTPQLSSPPFQSVVLQESDKSTEKTILLACIIATTGVIIILATFLMFRFAGRRAIRRHDEEMERRERKREHVRQRRMKEYNEAHVEWAHVDE